MTSLKNGLVTYQLLIFPTYTIQLLVTSYEIHNIYKRKNIKLIILNNNIVS